jgi:hypothetical protein
MRFEAINRASVMVFVAETDDVDQHVIDVVDQSDMVPDSYIPMMGRRRRKLTAKVRGYGVSLLAKVRMERFPGL